MKTLPSFFHKWNGFFAQEERTFHVYVKNFVPRFLSYLRQNENLIELRLSNYFKKLRNTMFNL